MNYYCSKIDFATPEFDEALRLRYDILRKPLNLEFELEDILTEYLECHFAIFNYLDQIVGTVSYRELSDDVIKMRQMAIASEYQGQKLGKTLIRYTEKWAIRKGYKKIELHARKTAVPFYEKFGYRTEFDEFEEVGIPHLKMYKVV